VCVCRLSPDSTDDKPLHVTNDTPPNLMPLSSFADLDASSQWHIVSSIEAYVEAFDSRLDRKAQKKQMVFPYSWVSWMGDQDVEFMLHARSNNSAWSAFKTRGSDLQKSAYETWNAKFKANPTLEKNAPGYKEHSMGAKYVRYVKLTSHTLFVCDYLYTRSSSRRFLRK
jgi:hypothetical protein